MACIFRLLLKGFGIPEFDSRCEGSNSGSSSCRIWPRVIPLAKPSRDSASRSRSKTRLICEEAKLASHNYLSHKVYSNRKKVQCASTDSFQECRLGTLVVSRHFA